MQRVFLYVSLYVFMYFKIYDLSIVQFGPCDLKSGMGWNTSSLFLCEIPDCQNPIGAAHTRQRGSCSLLPLKKQTLLPWNTCHTHPTSLAFGSFFSLAHHPLTYFYSLFFPLCVSCFPTSALSHKAVFSLDVFVFHLFFSSDRPCEKNNTISGHSPFWHHFIF